MKAILKQFAGKSARVPAKLLKQFEESDVCAPYLVSCFSRPPILYVSPKFDTLTGHSGRRFMDEGNQFWFTLIHPADLPGVTNAIARAHHDLATKESRPDFPLQLEYRITRGDGRLIWIRELKFIVTYRDGIKDHGIGCLRDITLEKDAEANEFARLARSKKGTDGLLDVALSYHPARRNLRSGIKISAREQQVLGLVAAGSSTKLIAAQLAISENTVETHRRNLLKKFKVNNSTALIKEAQRLAWL